MLISPVDTAPLLVGQGSSFASPSLETERTEFAATLERVYTLGKSYLERSSQAEEILRAARANSAEVARLQSELERIFSENTRLASEAEEAKVLLDCRDKEAEAYKVRLSASFEDLKAKADSMRQARDAVISGSLNLLGRVYSDKAQVSVDTPVEDIV